MTLAATAPIEALQQAWPAFVLVTGLLLLGLVAERDGLFARLGERLERTPGPPVALYVASLGAVVAVTAVLNLDTAVVFVTPVVVHAARRRGLDPLPVTYATLIMANAGSLLLPGANLTNLIVRGADPGTGARWLIDVAPAGAAAAVVSLLVLVLVDRPAWRDRRHETTGRELARPDVAAWRIGPNYSAESAGHSALVAVGAAAAAVLVLDEPALPVLGVGLLAAGHAVARGRTAAREAIGAVAPGILLALLALVTALGVLARSWAGPDRLVADAAPLLTAGIGALASILVNNLPASALLTAGTPAHPEALLVGLNVGPNLFVTGSLAAWLWWRACRRERVPVTLRGLLIRGPASALPAIVIAALLVAG